MENNQSISNAPMILGIIGGVLGIPGALCAGACAAGISSLASSTTEEASSIGEFYMWMGLLGAVLGLLCSFLYKKNPKLWGCLMLVSAFMTGITLITFNFLSLIVCVLLLIAGILAMTCKKPEPRI